MSDFAGLRKPLQPFVKFVAIVAAVIVGLDIALGVFSSTELSSSNVRLGLGNEALGPVLISFWIGVAEQILQHIAYLIGLGVVIELVDRILWRLTPEAERRVERAR